jgi:hypothetical protein
MKPIAMTERMTFVPLTDHQRRVAFVALHTLAAAATGYDRDECEELGRLILGSVQFDELSA